MFPFNWRVQKLESKPEEIELFTVYVGKVGSGKTTAIAFDALAALRRGEPVFTNVALRPADTSIRVFDTVDNWQHAGSPKPAVIRWHEPIELLHPAVRCGLVCFDELGAYVNNREHETWPFQLTVKLICLRKSHISVAATVQDDELADKNMRRFYQRLFICHEIRLPLYGLLRPGSRRPKLPCELPGCNKNHGNLSRGDRWSFGTVYALKDVHPKYAQNKLLHHSRGIWWREYEPDVAACFNSQQDVTADALTIYERSKGVYNSRQRQRGRYHDEE